MGADRSIGFVIYVDADGQPEDNSFYTGMIQGFQVFAFYEIFEKTLQSVSTGSGSFSDYCAIRKKYFTRIYSIEQFTKEYLSDTMITKTF